MGQKELRRLQERRRKLDEKAAKMQERQAEERKKKAAEREERSNLTLELEKVRTERDVALKQVELLQMQVGELQKENTALVARLGKAGALDRSDSASISSGKLPRASTSKSQKSS